MARKYEILNLPQEGSWPAILCLMLGVVYFTAGLAQIITAMGILPLVPGPVDLLGGALLAIVASVFLSGVKPLRRNEEDGYAFIAVGYILAGVLFALQILVIGTNALGWLLQFEDWLSWNIINDLNLSFWLFIGLMLATGALWFIGDLKGRAKLASGVNE